MKNNEKTYLEKWANRGLFLAELTVNDLKDMPDLYEEIYDRWNRGGWYVDDLVAMIDRAIDEDELGWKEKLYEPKGDEHTAVLYACVKPLKGSAHVSDAYPDRLPNCNLRIFIKNERAVSAEIIGTKNENEGELPF